MNLARSFVVLLIIWVAGVGGAAVEVKAQNVDHLFKDTTGAFVLYDLNNRRYFRYNDERCRQKFSPFSTFKIPNSLISLETGVIKDADFVVHWDRQKYPPPPNGWTSEPFVHWGQDQTLRTAMKYSVVWYYREAAQKVGAKTMKSYVEKFRYGNRDTSGGITQFWLGSTMKISANQQVEFLKAFYQEKLPVSKRSVDIVKDIILLEQTPAYRLSGKTGGGSLDNGKTLGWFVGYLEKGGNVYFFAANIEGVSFGEIRDKRVQLTKQVLAELGYLPKQ